LYIRQVLRLFKALHRTRQHVFRDDTRALRAAREKINEEFKKYRNETFDSSGAVILKTIVFNLKNIFRMIKIGSDVEVILRKTVIQGVHVEDKKIQLRYREEHLLENQPYCDNPTKKNA
ncbi:complex III assembly factor LYRM7 isoform X1, partial [Huso huso]